MPTESEFLAFFLDLRVNKKRASSSMWTVFSMFSRGSGSTDYAALVESYLSQIKDDLGKYTGNSFVYHREIKSIRGFSLLFSCEIEICSPFKKL